MGFDGDSANDLENVGRELGRADVHAPPRRVACLVRVERIARGEDLRRRQRQRLAEVENAARHLSAAREVLDHGDIVDGPCLLDRARDDPRAARWLRAG
jgi:hypothetical protein